MRPLRDPVSARPPERRIRPSGWLWEIATRRGELMKLPNSDRAVVDIRKLRDYALSSDHRRGRHKARVFAARLGLKAEHAEALRAALLAAARDGTRSKAT